jgi:hypothetical protein
MNDAFVKAHDHLYDERDVFIKLSEIELVRQTSYGGSQVWLKNRNWAVECTEAPDHFLCRRNVYE